MNAVSQSVSLPHKKISPHIPTQCTKLLPQLRPQLIQLKQDTSGAVTGHKQPSMLPCHSDSDIDSHFDAHLPQINPVPTCAHTYRAVRPFAVEAGG